jgi:serine/threonine protein phosphatase PrpC
MMSLSSAVLSHPGLRREANEDSVCARQDIGLFLVADAMRLVKSRPSSRRR